MILQIEKMPKQWSTYSFKAVTMPIFAIYKGRYL